nr:uncharacterized mitochondrial protein AtMg00810-like [Tanacetum cinerariifolium]
MTDHKEKLADFVQVKGGTVTFGCGDENQLNKKVKAIRCDNGTEFQNVKLIALCGEKGIKRDYSNARNPQQNGVAERKNRTFIEAARSMLADSKLPTMFCSEAVSTACCILNRVSITNPYNTTLYELLSGKIPNIRHLKPFGCQVNILNTSDHLGKFEGKANDGFLVGYAAHSKAYRVYNLSSKKVEEMLNLRYLEDKPNVQGLGQEWYFDLDYLTDSIGYTRFKTNTPTGTDDTNILAGTQADDSNSECDEQVILVPSFPYNSFSGPTVQDVSTPMENNLDYAEELARLQRQEYEAHSAVAKHGFEFFVDTAALLPQANIEICRNLVPAAGDPAGGIVSTGGVPVGSDPAGGIIPTGGVLAGSSVPASDVPAGSIPARSVSAGGVLAGSLVSTDYAASPVLSLDSCAHTTRFPSPHDLGSHQHTAGIFSSSSYDDDFCADVTNLDSNVDVDPIATKRVNSIHPQSQILGDLQSLVQTRSIVQKSKFGDSAFISYVQNQNRTNHADHLHCLFACFLSQLEPSSVATALADPDWVAAMQEEMQQFYHQQVWKLVPLPAGKITIGTKWILKNKRDARGIVVYVDDIIFGSTNKSWCDEFEVLMKGEFEMSAMRELTFFLGLQVKQLSDGIFISQDKYVKDMLKKFDMESVRTATTPYEVPKHKSKYEPDDAVNVHLFRSMIGSLMYLTASQLDIMFAVSACSKHQVSPLTSHLNAVKKIFKYLKGQPNLGLWYPRDSPFQLEAYSDSDYVGSHGDRKSTTGGCQFLGTGIREGLRLRGGLLLYILCTLTFVQVLLLVVQVRADVLVFAGGCTLFAGSYSFLLLDWFLLVVDDHNKVAYLEKRKGWEAYEQILDFLNRSHIRYALTHRPTMVLDSLVKQFWATATVRTLEAGPSDIIATIDGTEVVVIESLIRTQLQLDDVNGLYEFTFHDVLDGMREIGYHTDGSLTFYKAKLLPQWRFFIHTLIHCMSPKSGGWNHFPSSLASALVFLAGGDAAGAAANVAVGPGPSSAPSLPSLPPSSAAIGPTTSSRPLTTAAGGAEDSAALTALSLKLDTCLHRVTTLENELGITKKVLGGAVLKLVTRFDLAALHTLAGATLGDDSSAIAVGPDAKTTMLVHSTSTTRRRLRKQFTSSVSAHVSETIPAGVRVPAAVTTIPAGSSVDVVIHVAAAHSSSIPTAADKGKAPMVDDSIPADLLSKQERVLKNLHDSQLGEELAKKIHAEQEAKFARQQEELAQKAQAKSVASPTELAPGIASVYNQGWTMKKVKALSIAQLRLEFEYIQKHLERSNFLNFRRSTFHPKPTLDAPPAKRVNQGAPQVSTVSSQDPAGVPAAPSIPADVSLPTATSSAPADILVHAVSIAHAAVSVPVEQMVHPAESHMDAPLTAPEHGFSEPTVAAPPLLSSRHRRKHIAKKRVTPIVDVVDAAMIKFDSDSDSDDDSLPYATYVGWEMVPSPLGSVHAYHSMAGHTKHFTTLREILHMVERTDLQRLLGAVDALYQSEEPNTFALLLWGDLHVLFQSLDDKDAFHF